jgi:hypothetical protein
MIAVYHITVRFTSGTIEGLTHVFKLRQDAKLPPPRVGTVIVPNPWTGPGYVYEAVELVK